jgi:autotransporter passenger strand-loop-strand repeat protein
VSGLIVSSGQTLIVSSGGTASATKVLKGGEIVYAGGTVKGAVVSSGAIEGVGSGATISGFTVGTGITLSVLAGGTASNTLLNGGTEIVSSGGIIGGIVKFGTNAKLSIAATKGVAVTLSGFKATDTLDLAGFAFKTTEKLSFVENAAKTSGTLRVTDGTQRATITLFGQYVAAGFHVISDGAVGSVVSYGSATAMLHDLAGKPG